MIKKIIILCIFCCGSYNLSAQFFDEFNDSDLQTNPRWEGNLEDFQVNDAGQLQLNAVEEGNSILYTQLAFPDSIQWDMELLLDFSPSDNNRLRVYLALDELVLENASGYFLEVGENGSNDALNFYFLNNGSPELIASGEMAALASQPAYANVIITRFPPGDWVVSTSYDEGVPAGEELTFFHNEYDFSGNQVFLLDCNYTDSRKDKFFFDNIGVKKFEPDTEGPIILDASLLGPRLISVRANERLSLNSALQAGNYSIEGYNGEFTNIELNEDQTGVTIELSSDLEGGRNYVFNVSGLQDENGNVGDGQMFTLFLLQQPEPGEILLNEILFNPETGGSDFIEIVNVSSKFITLENLEIRNSSRDESKILQSDIVLEPGQYLCMTEDVSYLQGRYGPPDTARFLNTELPAFNNDNGNVSIINPLTGEIIDSYDYDEETHFSELDDLNGVSLERVSFTDNKWFSAASSVGFATPGYKNSIFLNPNLEGDELLSFESTTFSPNQDGMDDQLVVKYSFPDIGFQVDIEIYDQFGRQVRKLVNNELLSQEGFILWDGLTDANEIADVGIYFVVLEAFNVQGDVISAKKTVVLADFLK